MKSNLRPVFQPMKSKAGHVREDPNCVSGALCNSFPLKRIPRSAIRALCLCMCLPAQGEPGNPAPMKPADPVPANKRILYPWKQFVESSLVYVGESTEGSKSATCIPWDAEWKNHFGGNDDPEPGQRIADFQKGDFRPKSFVPKLNPFYVALPYNDLLNATDHKPDADDHLPWAAGVRKEAGTSRCKDRWVQIYRAGKSCYGQWEACGPFLTDDWEFVFGNKPPKNGGAGIAVSPAVRDYLELPSGAKVHWRFVEAGQVPYGPWNHYGQKDPGNEDATAAQKRYLEYLRKKRDEQAHPQEKDAQQEDTSTAKPDVPTE